MKQKKDKDRRSVVPLDLQQYATEYLESHHKSGTEVDTALQECRTNLRQLITHKTTTDDQARLLRVIGTTLVKSIGANESQFLTQIDSVRNLMRIVIRFYFYKDTKPVHKQVSWIVDNVINTINDREGRIMVHDLIHTLFRERFQLFINESLFDDEFSFADDLKNYTNQLEIFEHLIDLEQFRDDINAYFTTILSRCATILDKLLISVTSEQQVLSQAAFIVVGIFKLVTSLSTKNLESMNNAIQDQNASLVKIVECGFRALINPNFSRDAHRIPLLILYKLLDLSFINKDELGDLFLESYFEPSTLSGEEFEQLLPTIFVKVVIERDPTLLRAAYTHFTEMSKIAAVGTLFNAFPSAVLLRQVDRNGAPFSLLFDGALPQLHEYCSTGSTLLHKLLAIQRTYAAALQLKTIVSEGTTIENQQRIAETVKKLFNVVFDNWENTMYNIHEM
jgi:hypothetical protein